MGVFVYKFSIIVLFYKVVTALWDESSKSMCGSDSRDYYQERNTRLSSPCLYCVLSLGRTSLIQKQVFSEKKQVGPKGQSSICAIATNLL